MSIRLTFRYRTVLLALCALVPNRHLKAQQTWRIDPKPVTVIEDDGTPATQWRALAGAVVLGSGEVLVADAVGEVRRFGRDGRYLDQVMRSGDGPRELPRVATFMPWRDGAAALTDREFLTFSATGARKGSLRAGAGPPTGTLAAMLYDESLLAVQVGFKIIAPPTRVLRDSVSVSLRSADGPSRPLARVPYSTALILEVPSAPGGLRYGVLEGAPQLLVTARDSLIWFGGSDASSFTRVSVADPTSRRSVTTRAGPPAAWTASRLEAWKRWALSRATTASDSALASARWSRQHLPSHAPLFRSVTPDVHGGLWIERFPMLPTDAPEWLVYAPSGTLLARVRLPRPARLLSLQPTSVAVAERDENDVERVVVYTLHRR